MAPVTERTWSMLAFKKQGAYEDDTHRRGLPEWRIGQAVMWAAANGNDTILIEVSNVPPSSTREKTHHVCDDPSCPGGCE